ncbi:MAG: OmpA family protein [Spirosomataceae bacterium]
MLQDSITKPIIVKVAPLPVSRTVSENPIQTNKPVKKEVGYTGFDDKNVKVGTSILLKNIRFLQSKADLLPESNTELEHLLGFMREHPTAEIELQGHTDNLGDFDLNLKLSKQRVEAVKAFLVSNGIAAHRISGKGFGSTRPIANNNREETRHLNRRVELIIKKF